MCAKINFKVGVYLRLSREDGDKVESDSITNQRIIIGEYIKAHDDLVKVEEYIDDGYTGTNFDRPGFQRLLEDIRNEKINCLIVKDSSRLGRNYIETGRYMEKIFPQLGIRLISVLEHYDSENDSSQADQIIMPFRNLINDSYCRDMSMKIRSQLDVKRRNGEFIGSFTSYGYLKDPDNVNRLIIDEEAAGIVKRIFSLKLQGYNSSKIAAELNEMGVLPPAEYKRSNGMKYDCGFRTGNHPKWTEVPINRILTNEIYTGVMVQGKRKKINYRIKQSRAVPEEEWIRVEGTHEAIIEKAIFEDVQRILRYDTRTAPEKNKVYALSGFVVCGDCGQNMVRRKVTKKGKAYVYLHCSTYKSNQGCTAHLIRYENLESIVLNVIRKQCELLTKAADILATIDKIPENQVGVQLVDQQLENMAKERERYKELKVKLYVDMLDELISKEEFKDINRRFGLKIEQIEKTIQQLNKKRKRLLANKTYLKPWVEQFKQNRNIDSLERETVISLIQEIIVYDKNHITINFQYGDEMAEMIQLAGLDQETREVRAYASC